MYLSCQQHCDMDCPYPGSRAPGSSEDEPVMPELSDVDASDHSFLSRLLYRGGGRGGGGASAGGLGDAVSKLFQIV